MKYFIKSVASNKEIFFQKLHNIFLLLKCGNHMFTVACLMQDKQSQIQKSEFARTTKCLVIAFFCR